MKKWGQNVISVPICIYNLLVKYWTDYVSSTNSTPNTNSPIIMRDFLNAMWIFRGPVPNSYVLTPPFRWNHASSEKNRSGGSISHSLMNETIHNNAFVILGQLVLKNGHLYTYKVLVLII